MADTLFIKATASCGYDKADVDKRLETLYSTIYNLKNEIRENKQIIKNMRTVAVRIKLTKMPLL